MELDLRRKGSLFRYSIMRIKLYLYHDLGFSKLRHLSKLQKARPNKRF